MAAPSSTIWGNTASNSEGHEAKIGFAITRTDSASTSTIVIDIWFWSEYSVLDKVNTLYFNNESTSATTSRGNVSIDTKVNSAWSTSNQVLLGTYTYYFTRGSSDVTKHCAAKLSTVEAVSNNPLTVSASYVIPKKVSVSQDVYIYDDGTVYARAFLTASTIYIDNTGAIYAPKFTTGSSFSISSSGITAKAFIEGTP